MLCKRILFSLLLLALLCGCGQETTFPITTPDSGVIDESAPERSQFEEEEPEAFLEDREPSTGNGSPASTAIPTLDTPFLLGSGSCTLPDGSVKYIYCTFVRGMYIHDKRDTDGGLRYEGEGEILVFDEEQDMPDISTLFENGAYGDGYISIDAPVTADGITVPVSCDEPFPILFEDYNGDGCPDFTIGRRYNLAHNGYHLFTIRESGDVELLFVRHPEGLPDSNAVISHKPKESSIRLYKTGDSSFSAVVFRPGGVHSVPEEIWDEFVENEQQFFTQYFEIHYEWADGAFHYLYERPVSNAGMSRYSALENDY